MLLSFNALYKAKYLYFYTLKLYIKISTYILRVLKPYIKLKTYIPKL